MGIPKLNKMLMESCSQKSIKKIHLKELYNKKIAVDISIYLYKFLAEDNFMENLYLFLSVFKYYCAIPIFIFDGKPPIEKYALLKRRYSEKQQAYSEYQQIEKMIENVSDQFHVIELQNKMSSLKKKMVRITSAHIEKVIELIKAFGYEYYFAPNEADQLCVYLTIVGKTYATLSDDMDIIVSGCPIVFRNLSLLNHEVMMYHTTNILNDLELSLPEFRNIVILSGTDYDVSNKSSSVISIRKAFDYYKKYKTANLDKCNDFYMWLNDSGIIKSDDLYKISKLFDVENYTSEMCEFVRKNTIEKPRFNVSLIKSIMRQYKFIFV